MKTLHKITQVSNLREVQAATFGGWLWVISNSCLISQVNVPIAFKFTFTHRFDNIFQFLGFLCSNVFRNHHGARFAALIAITCRNIGKERTKSDWRAQRAGRENQQEETEKEGSIDIHFQSHPLHRKTRYLFYNYLTSSWFFLTTLNFPNPL